MADDADPAARPLWLGESLALAHVASNRNPRFAVGALGGRFVLFCVIGDAAHSDAIAALAAIPAPPSDETERVCAVFYTESNATPPASLANRLVFADAAVAAECGLPDARMPEGRWILFDPSSRVLAIWPLAQAKQALAALAQTPSPDQHAGTPIHAPVLIAPRVFEPEFCKRLIAYYDARGATPRA